MRFFTIFSVLTLTAAGARAQEVTALVLGAESNDSWLIEVSNTLMATGEFAQVDWINPRTTTPSLATLLNYDAVLVWSDASYADSFALGDNLADYVDEGGGVVVGVWAVTNYSTSLTLQGRWTSGPYQVMMNDDWYVTGSANLGTVHDPAHPIMQGGTSFDGGTSGYRGIGTNINAGAYRVADWSDGNILVAVKDDAPSPRVDVNIFPPSSASRGDFWQTSTDGARMLANALVYTSGGGTPQLEITMAIPGAYLTFDISRLRAEADVITILSSRGAGPTSTPFGEIEVTQPWFRTPPFRADAQGNLNYSITLPSGAIGHTIYAQAVELGDGEQEPRISTAVVQPLN